MKLGLNRGEGRSIVYLQPPWGAWMCWIDDDHNDHHGDGDDKDDHHGDDKDDDDKMWRPLDCLDPTTVSGSRRIVDDHNDH